MTFKLDPVSTLEAIQKAKAWQGGSTSPMNFSSGLVARRGMDRAIQDIGPWKERPFPQQIILPETGVFSSDGVGNILGGLMTDYGNEAELSAQAFGSMGDVRRSNMKLEFAKEMAEKRNEQSGGSGIGRTIGRTLGTFAGNAILPGIGGPIGGGLGDMIGGSIG